MNINPLAAFILFPMMLLMLELGRRIHQRFKEPLHSPAIEGALFSLFGLLLAFTFSGAVSRYDEHRRLIVQETDHIGTVRMYLRLLPSEAQPPLRQLLREYTASRLHLFDSVRPEISPDSLRLQSEIWRSAAAAATSPKAGPDVVKLLFPALNNMIGITYTRQNAFNMHPPAPVYLLLFAFSGACAFTAGYGLRSNRPDWFYAVVLAFAVTLTVYATLEIEFPRRGLIRFTQLDQPFINLDNAMNSVNR